MSDAPSMTRIELDAWMRSEIASATGLQSDEVDLGRSFGALGLDSMSAVAVLGGLCELVGREIDVSELFEHGSPTRLLDAVLAGPRPDTLDVGWTAGPSAVASPVSITGMACRFPGAPDPLSFWRMLLDGADAVGPVPPVRSEGWTDLWDVPPNAGFLSSIDQFDASFFDISGAEADRMDPQQRLLLEVVWEAIEDAGILPSDLAGSRTGVFVGISSSDYAQRYLNRPDGVDGLVATGNALSIAANRLSFTLDLRGPSMSIDTACSSSLVAVHQACRALAAGECETAIVAGANLVLEPGISLALERAGMLASDGRCKSFDDRADGYVRGEGVGAVILESRPARSSRAYAAILGSSVTQDGATAGLTAPNPAAQRAAVAEAWRAAGAPPREVDYVECHGTGTALGDPIEAAALGAVLGGGRAHPCLVGSVKSNIGHLEAAAGIAGLIKAALAVHYGQIPPTLHFDRPNRHIDFDGLGLEVAAGTVRPWPGGSPRRLCGVSSFGFGGTNSHVALGASELKQGVDASVPPVDAVPIILSSHTVEALDDLAGRWVSALRRGAISDLAAAARTAAVHRGAARHRCAVVGTDAAEIADRLAAERTVVTSLETPPSVVLVFAGQGGSWVEQAADLLVRCPSFRAVMSYCDEVLGDLAGWSLMDRVRDGSPGIENDQPARVAFQIALAAAWRSFGVHPHAVVGHSLGEIAAAHVAGVLKVEEALALAHRRGEAMVHLQPGGMLATDLDEGAAEEAAEEFGIEIAAVNANDILVLSGPEDGIGKAAEELARRGSMARRLPLPAFHSALTQGAADALLHDPPGVGAVADLLWCSTVTGQRLVRLEPDHWARNVRGVVRFRDALMAAVDELGGSTVLVGVGPPNALRAAVDRVAAQCYRVESLQAGNGWSGLLTAATQLWQVGTHIEWRTAVPVSSVCSLPTRAWSRSRHWVERPKRAPGPTGHPLLGVRRDLAGVDAEVFESTISTDGLPFLADHRVDGSSVMPAAGFVQLLVEAAGSPGTTVRLSNLDFQAPLFLDDEGCILQTTLRPLGDGVRGATVHSRRDGQGGWTTHLTARVELAPPSAAASGTPALEPLTDGEEVTGSELYRRLGTIGLGYGAAFRVVESVRTDGVAASGRIHASRDLIAARCGSDPRVIDGALHLVGALLPSEVEGRVIVMPVAVDEIVVSEPMFEEVEAAIRLDTDGAVLPGTVAFGLEVRREGRLAVRASGVRLRMIPRDEPVLDASPVQGYERVWLPSVPDADGGIESLDGARVGLVIADGPACDALGRELRDVGAEVVLLPEIVAPRGGRGDQWLDPERVDDLLAPLGRASARAHVVMVPPAMTQDGSPPDLDQATRFLHLLQSLSFLEGASTPRLWVMTHGAQAVVEGDLVDSGQAAMAFGLARVLPFENPLLQCRFVDVSADLAPNVAARHLVGEMLRSPAEAELAFRDDTRFVRRLHPSVIAASSARNLAGGSYVVTGGAGALGMLTASRLLERGASAVGLVSRRAPGPDAAAALEHWVSAGLPVRSYQADISNREEVGRVLDDLRAIAPIRGVVHAAGTLQDGALLEMSRDALHKVLAPKALGAWNLHQATLQDDLELFVLYSSAASVVGSPGQGNYCAANAYLDALAEDRRSRGLPAVAINWGPWSDVGMAASLGGVGSSKAVPLPIAESSIAPHDGIDAFESLATAPRSVLALGVDLLDLVRFYPAELGYSLFAAVTEAQEHDLRGHGGRHGPVARPDIARTYVAPKSALEARIVAIWEASLGIEPIGVHDGFFELGGDSVFANQILVQIRRVLGVELDSEQAFAEFTVAHLAEMADAAMVARIEAMSDDEVARMLEG